MTAERFLIIKTESLTTRKIQKLRNARISLALIMRGQSIEESCIKIAPVQNQNYFMDKWIVDKRIVYGKKNILFLGLLWVLLIFLLRVRNMLN